MDKTYTAAMMSFTEIVTLQKRACCAPESPKGQRQMAASELKKAQSANIFVVDPTLGVRPSDRILATVCNQWLTQICEKLRDFCRNLPVLRQVLLQLNKMPSSALAGTNELCWPDSRGILPGAFFLCTRQGSLN
ncbi:hypothetical protein LOY69_15695 [Pseudomonas sp. B21-059]|uniref:hypothetical protein n=1 Tax=Pseudomonas sp. B21-059 TaxID=2895496 RepID=UPI002234874B|nr:hypothetical protein [Pseudomonas sp. B21-059]UZE37963.1 hypothetical protein LOY69_15695 [Pseudomonas sp. B21-059]